MSVYALAGYGKPEKFIIEHPDGAEKVEAYELDVMFVSSNLLFSGRFEKGTRRPHKKDYFERRGTRHWFVRRCTKDGETVTEVYEGELPECSYGYPFIWDMDLEKLTKCKLF